ncbi:MAG TPA: sugar phosphate isomerase/epimerase [Bryobacteraceae bacterium]|nr:sugar phosphate isomerase/epimerase [Bryobacteraceae bacterium]
MPDGMDRRTLFKTLGVGAGVASFAALASGAPTRKIKIGETSINWGSRAPDAEPGIRDCAKLGFWGYEALGVNLETLEAAPGGLGRILDQYQMPLPSTYFNVNLSDPALRKSEVEKVVRWGKIVRKYGGRIGVLGPNHVNRSTYDFKAARPEILASLNDIGKALADIGMVASLHQHTDTCVESHDEVYAVLEAVDTRVVKFGPDVGQLAKGGSDPVRVLTDFQPLLQSIHLKDYLGGPHWAGYCPLGQGKVNLPVILDILEKAPLLEYVMVELDRTPNAPMDPLECARASKEYLIKLGYKFRV